LLNGASIRAIAEIAYNLTFDDILGEFIKARVVDTEEEFGDMVNEINEDAAFAGGKRKQAELGLLYLDRNRKKDLLPVASALVSQAFDKIRVGKDEVEQLNKYLVRDGFQYDRQKKLILPTVGRPKVEKQIYSELDARLDVLNPRLTRMHNGIWEVLASGSSDAGRHAVSSSRELLRQVVDGLVGPSGNGLTRKAKIRRLLKSERNTEVIDSVARLVDSIYSSGSVGEHTSVTTETAALLGKMTEYCLLFLLRRVQGKIKLEH
jgi:hypothetical protein